MAPTIEQFAANVVASGLMSAEELAKCQAPLPPERRPSSAEELAKLLVRQRRLTPFQAKCLWQGDTKGLVFGEYVVLDKIGQGGMGVVLKARHRRMDRLVALKTLPRPAMKQPGAVERFYREVKAAARLNHPNIVTAYDAGECQGVHYLVMEYVDGQDLASLIKEHGPLPISQALEFVIQAARGLAYAHQQGIVHRDIKPGNLLVDRSGVVKILDMGLARFLVPSSQTSQTEEPLTGTAQVMGTCDYMAPEQAVSTHHVDGRADIYSLGCTLYRLITGRTPYQGHTLLEVLMAHREAPIPSMRALRPEVPEPLDAVFQRMVAKQPEDRYASMGEVVTALEACQAKRVAVPVSDSQEPVEAGELSVITWLERISQSQPRESPPGSANATGKELSETLPCGPDHATTTLVGAPAGSGPAVTSSAGAAAQGPAGSSDQPQLLLAGQGLGLKLPDPCVEKGAGGKAAKPSVAEKSIADGLFRLVSLLGGKRGVAWVGLAVAGGMLIVGGCSCSARPRAPRWPNRPNRLRPTGFPRRQVPLRKQARRPRLRPKYPRRPNLTGSPPSTRRRPRPRPWWPRSCSPRPSPSTRPC